ncbi:MAG TPA: hypothetical protein VFN09_09235 [Rhodanobacteraceae bacterium]|nr:hypothetical protein [Rhodanobacteraceae bacterium]
MTVSGSGGEAAGLRVRPAEYARMVAVSKQTVSRWIKDGKVTLGQDGMLDPRKASREVVRNTDPVKLRARLFGGDLADLVAMVSRMEAALAASERREQVAQFAADERADKALCRFMAALHSRFGEAVAAHAVGTLRGWLDELAAVEVYGFDLDEYRAEVMADSVPCHDKG